MAAVHWRWLAFHRCEDSRTVWGYKAPAMLMADGRKWHDQIGLLLRGPCVHNFCGGLHAAACGCYCVLALVSRIHIKFLSLSLYEKNNFALSFRPWVRIPEDEKETPLSSDGDDNPDISDYMGHFELGLVYKWDEYEFSFQGRENFAKHHGGFEIGFTFPLWGKLRGYTQFTSGYGESLIDYNHSQQRFGLGIALTNVL